MTPKYNEIYATSVKVADASLKYIKISDGYYDPNGSYKNDKTISTPGPENRRSNFIGRSDTSGVKESCNITVNPKYSHTPECKDLKVLVH